VNLKDLEAVDYELYKSLTRSLCVLIVTVVVLLADASLSGRTNIMGVFDETFSVTEDCFSEHVVVELMPGGTAQDVTEVNKEEYVDLVVAHRIAEQFRAFMEGLGDMLPLDLLRVFMIEKSGSPNVATRASIASTYAVREP